jgi:hypothetical protein
MKRATLPPCTGIVPVLPSPLSTLDLVLTFNTILELQHLDLAPWALVEGKGQPSLVALETEKAFELSLEYHIPLK